MVQWLIKKRFTRTPEFQRTTHAVGTQSLPDLVDLLILTPAETHDPENIFPLLRWGGQVVVVSRDLASIHQAAKAYRDWCGGGGWVIETPPTTLKKYPLNLRFLLFKTRVHFLVARKVALVRPGDSSDRFTYNVMLAKNPGRTEYEVIKQVPSTERVLARLRDKFPEADLETLRRRARKFTEKIFPVFLTRETAILKLLQRDLPKQFRHLVPRVLHADQDQQGYIRTLHLNWLRNGGAPISQIEFAKQSAELLTALHDDAKVIHLDLRLDNFVITPDGVGFVDFGSAVRVGEHFPEESLLNTLFEEMMRTSQIQRMLGKMSDTGMVTSQEIRSCYGRIDKGVDFFYLAVQINSPHSNPDFKGLVKFDPKSREAEELGKLTELILRPTDTADAQFKSAKDILAGILEVEKRLKQK